LCAALACDGFVFGCESLSVLLETFDAEKFCLKRLLIGITGRYAY
jgi:hypothetical protein